MSQEEVPSRVPGESDAVRPWAVFLGTTVAVATVTVAVTWGIRRLRASRRLADVPAIIQDCFDRIHQIEADLRKSRPAAESAH